MNGSRVYWCPEPDDVKVAVHPIRRRVAGVLLFLLTVLLYVGLPWLAVYVACRVMGFA